MDAKTVADGSFKLELVEEVPRAVTPEAPASIEIGALDAAPRPHASDTDPYLAQAKREHDNGNVDAALWSRSLSLANGDEAAALAPYLRARAAVLKLAQGRRQAAVRAKARAPATMQAEPAERPRRMPAASPRALAFAVAGVAVVALAVVGWMMLDSQDAPAKPVVATTDSAARARVAAAATVVAPAPVDPAVDLAAKVASLKEAGNWNVLVLYANEWTRKQPDSAAAWYELGAGYAKLRQSDEAFEAAKKAVALDPARAAYRLGLADVFLMLDRSGEALAEVEKAIELDGGHAGSLARAGVLYLQLTRLGEARTAFDRAIALDPANTVASCGAVEVARRQGRAKDADALARALKAAEFDCGDPQVAKLLVAEKQATASLPAPTGTPARR